MGMYSMPKYLLGLTYKSKNRNSDFQETFYIQCNRNVVKENNFGSIIYLIYIVQIQRKQFNKQ